MTLYVFDLIGVGVFAASGVIAAGRKGLDLVGVIVLAAVTAIGGGTLRDLLLDRHPLFWLDDPAYLAVILTSVPVTIALSKLRLLPRRPLIAADSLGLALFAVLGTRIAESTGLPWPAVLLMGVITGVAGGIVRDVLTNEVPIVIRPGELYATAALAGAATDIVLRRLGLLPTSSLLAGVAIVVLLRYLSVRRRWHLPEIRIEP